MKRSGPPRRTTPLPRATKPIKRSGIRRKQRSAKDFERIYGNVARVKFVSRLPCFACDYAGIYPRQNAHTVTGGTGRKADYTTILALCGPCHRKQDGVNGGWLVIGMTSESCRRGAALTEALWQAHLTRGADDTP